MVRPRKLSVSKSTFAISSFRAPMSHSAASLRLSSHHDRALYARVFKSAGRIHIPQILTPDAAAGLHAALARELDYALVVNDGDKVWDIAPSDVKKMSEAERESLASAATSAGRRSFQFLFESVRLSEAGEAWAGSPAILGDLTRFLNGSAFLDFVRDVCGDTTIAFADAQATRYQPKHFLTAHDDQAEGKARRAAFVLNLTPNWKADWGGLLQFIDGDGHIAEAYTPAYNALNLFKVPSLHAVSYVNPKAAEPRLSITGWLRQNR